jgi:IS1 family transposase
MVSRSPRQIVGLDVAFDKSPERIQRIVDNAPDAALYCSDGWTGYKNIVYPGEYIQNTVDKSDTFTVEGVNADLRHYIPGLARRSRCFYRSLGTLKAVLQLFTHAYNQFGRANFEHPSSASRFALVNYLQIYVRGTPLTSSRYGRRPRAPLHCRDPTP